MPIRYERAVVDIQRGEMEPETWIRLRQYDEGLRVTISVEDDGMPVANEDGGLTCRVMCQTPGGLAEDELALADGVAEWEVGQDVTCRPGRYRPYVELRDADGNVAATGCLNLVVDQAADIDGEQAEASSSRLDQCAAAWDAFQASAGEEFDQAQAQRQSVFEQAEGARQDGYEEAEAAREAAQDANDAAQAKNNADQAANNQAAQGLVAVLLSSGQYDPDTLEPTVAPEVGKMYLVPDPGGEEDNLYVEWMHFGDAEAGAWERVGMTSASVEPVTTDDVDSVCADESPTADRVLNLTGLSYLWAKLKAAFAASAHVHAASDITSGTIPTDRLDMSALNAHYVNLLYPVGSVYVSRSDTSPETLFGVGTWQKVEGRFIYAADGDSPAGTEGGENEHVLTSDEMPGHTHAVTVASGGSHSHQARYTHFNGISIDSGMSNGYALIRRNQSGDSYQGTASNVAISAGAHTHTATAASVGGGTAHNNMPAYVAYNVWERTA